MKIFLKLFAYLPLAALMVVIFYLSSIPDLQSTPWFDFEHLDKIQHFGIYCLLGIFSAWAVLVRQERYSLEVFWEAVIVAGLYGALDEWHQSFVPQREASFADFGADLVGVFLGVWLCCFLYKRFKKRRIFSR